MSDSNKITVRGHVGTEPEVLVMNSGREMTKFRLASTRSYRDAASGEWRELGTEWFTVKAWGSAGEPIRRSIHRGMPVIVTGVLSSEEWVTEERTHHTNVITPGTIAVDIKYGLVNHHKLARQVDNGEPTADDADDAAESVDEQPEGAQAGDAPEPDDQQFTAAGVDPWLKAPIST